MSQISLLPQEYKKIAVKRKKKSFYFVFGLSLIGALVILNVLFFIINASYQNEKDSLKIQKNQLETMVQSFGKYTAVYSTMKEYEGYVKTATSASFNWSQILNEFSMTIPQGMWFDYINIEYDGKIAKFSVRGKVTDKMLVSEWLIRTEENKIFTNMVIKYLQDSLAMDMKTVNFEVAGNIDILKVKSERRFE